jgi:integrase
MGYVIHVNGKPIQDIKKAFRGACERAGLAVSGREKVTPHTLRHTAATWLMQAGVDMWEAAGFLAMSMETLERGYDTIILTT